MENRCERHARVRCRDYCHSLFPAGSFYRTLRLGYMIAAASLLSISDALFFEFSWEKKTRAELFLRMHDIRKLFAGYFFGECAIYYYYKQSELYTRLLEESWGLITIEHKIFTADRGLASKSRPRRCICRQSGGIYRLRCWTIFFFSENSIHIIWSFRFFRGIIMFLPVSDSAWKLPEATRDVNSLPHYRHKRYSIHSSQLIIIYHLPRRLQ